MLCGRLALRIVFLAAALLLLAKFGGVLFSVLLPFLAALLLAWAVNPLIRGLQRHFGGSRRVWAVCSTALIMVVLAVGLSAVVYLVYSQIRILVNDWPDLLSSFLVNLQTAFDRLTGLLGVQDAAASGLESGVQWLLEKLTEWLTGWDPPVLESAGNILTVTANLLITVAVFVLVSCYIMSDYPRFRYLLERALPTGVQSGLSKIKRAAASAIGGYFKAQFILSAVVAAICLVVLLILRQPFAVLIAVVIGIVDFVPIFGSGMILVPWAVILLFTGGYTKAAVLAVLAGGLFLFRKLAEPRVVGGQTGLSTLLSLACIYVGMRLGGVVGMILAPVLCMMFINLYHLGLFDATLDDCRDFSRHISNILGGGIV